VAKRVMKTVRIGVVGARRGMSFALGATDLVGMKLVAIREQDDRKRRDAVARLAANGRKVTRIRLRAVPRARHGRGHPRELLHRPRAVRDPRARRGKHVMKRDLRVHDAREGVALVEAVERAASPTCSPELSLHAFNQEMRRVYRTGAIGEFTYGEGEYVHPDQRGFLEQHFAGRRPLAQLLPRRIIARTRWAR